MAVRRRAMAQVVQHNGSVKGRVARQPEHSLRTQLLFVARDLEAYRLRVRVLKRDERSHCQW